MSRLVVANRAGRMADDLAAGTAAIAASSAVFDAVADALHADLADWRRSLAWDRQAPAPRHAVIEHP